MKYNSPKKSMKPKKFKQGFQTNENDLKEQEFVEFLQFIPSSADIINQFQSMLLDGINDICMCRY